MVRRFFFVPLGQTEQANGIVVRARGGGGGGGGGGDGCACFPPFICSILPIFLDNIACLFWSNQECRLFGRVLFVPRFAGEQTSGRNFCFAAGGCGGWCSLWSVVVRQEARAQMTWA